MIFPFRFREAQLASTSRHVTISFAMLFTFYACFFAAVPVLILAACQNFQLSQGQFELPWWLGAAVFTTGGWLTVVSVYYLAKFGRGTPWYGACPKKFVTSGPYRYVRNPQIIGLVIQGFGVGMVSGSPWVALYTLFGGPIWHFICRPVEEADLEVRFRGDYRLYNQAVPIWLPRLTPYRPRG